MRFAKPPVVETVLSVQFKPVADFGAGQLGAYWKQLGDNWKYVSDAHAIDPIYERFTTEPVWEPEAFALKLSQELNLRLQIRNTSKDRMIQLQNGRFFYNWLAGAPGVAYPSYDSVRPEFDEQWSAFQSFVAQYAPDNRVQPNQWEVLYVNHILRGTVWNCVDDLFRVFTFLKRPPVEGLDLSLDRIGGEWVFTIGSEQGRLYAKLGMTKKDDNYCAVLTFTARGPVGNEPDSLSAGIELGHEVITKAFGKLTSADAHKHWGIENDVAD